MFFKKKNKLVTHNGNFHADDIFAAATLQLMLDAKGEGYSITRTRDEKIINNADYVFDVGGIYDSSQNRFDHHQKGGAGERDNTVPYASAGLVWKEFGMTLAGSEKVAEIIDKQIMQSIDAIDNGMDISKTVIRDLYPLSFQTIVNIFRPTWNESDDSEDDKFLELVSVAKDILGRAIISWGAKVQAREHIKEEYKSTDQKDIVVFTQSYRRDDISGILTEFDEPIFFVYPKSQDGFWKAECVRKQMDSFENRKSFPESWAGKKDQELVDITGVDDAVFCHNARFLVVAKSKEGAEKLAKLAMSD